MTRETMAEAAARRRCPHCGKWFMSTAQRDAHVGKVHRVSRRHPGSVIGENAAGPSGSIFIAMYPNRAKP